MVTSNEKVVNGDIAKAMQRMAPNGYEMMAETQGQSGKDGTSPDIVVEMPYDLRMIIETEYGKPAIKDAISRLGYKFHNYSLPVKNVIALGIPEMLKNLTVAGTVQEVLENPSGEKISDPKIPEEVRTMLEAGDVLFPMQVVTGRSPEDPYSNYPL